MTAVTVIGAGVVGLCAAEALSARGARVSVVSREGEPDGDTASWWAGGMLAPDCEMEAAEPLIGRLGAEGIAFWTARGEVAARGTLVLALPRDGAELRRFAARTCNRRRIEGAEVATLEPGLSQRFPAGLIFEGEGHLDPRGAMARLRSDLAARGVDFRTGPPGQGQVVDARGLAARDILPDLRGVRGEMAMLSAPAVEITRTIRLLHPRWPVYLVPRGEGLYMLGATQIETERAGAPSLRSLLDLLGAAYALEPALAEAEVVETGAGLRPAFPDNLPRIRWAGGRLCVNGLYRHGFLCAPALARMAAEHLLEGRPIPEAIDGDLAERQSA